MTLTAVIILCSALTLTVNSVYLDNAHFIMMAPVAVLLTILGVFACDVTNKKSKRYIGTFVIVLYIALGAFIVRPMIIAGERATGFFFWQWTLSRGDDMVYAGTFIIAMDILCALFFPICVYYFTLIRYKIHMVTLISLMPFVLYVKVMADVANPYIILTTLAFLFVQISVNNDRKTEGFKYAIVGWVFFGLLISLIASVVPKRESARYYEVFEDLFLGGNTTGEISEGFETLGMFSGDADHFMNGTSRRLYTVSGDGSIYLRRQVFDIYDFEKDRWSGSGEDLTEDNMMRAEVEAKDMSYHALAMAFNECAENDPVFALKYRASEKYAQKIPNDIEKYITVRSENFGAAYYLSCAGVTKVLLNGGENGNIVRTDRDTYHTISGRHPDNYSYSIYYRLPASLPEWVATGLPEMDEETSLSLLQDMVILTYNSESIYFRNVYAFYDKFREALDYKEYVRSNTEQIPDSIKELAEKITKDCKYDWQKAHKLEGYFRESGFVYDLRYRAPDKSAEYFIFESKTGTCSDFATAYTLMARSIGLNARYTEGFISEPVRGVYGRCTVSESDSHAYAEVYLENTGWIVFDPTAGVEVVEHTGLLDTLKGIRADSGLILEIAIVIIFFGIVLIMIGFIIPHLAERFFRIRIALAGEDEAPLLVFRRIRKKLKSAGYDSGNMTPAEICDLVVSMGTDMTSYVNYLERRLYGGESDKNITGSELKDMRKNYRDFCRSLRKSIRVHRRESRASARRSRVYNNAGYKARGAREAKR